MMGIASRFGAHPLKRVVQQQLQNPLDAEVGEGGKPRDKYVQASAQVDLPHSTDQRRRASQEFRLSSKLDLMYLVQRKLKGESQM